jgi:hypothetical protein
VIVQAGASASASKPVTKSLSTRNIQIFTLSVCLPERIRASEGLKIRDPHTVHCHRIFTSMPRKMVLPLRKLNRKVCHPRSQNYTRIHEAKAESSQCNCVLDIELLTPSVCDTIHKRRCRGHKGAIRSHCSGVQSVQFAWMIFIDAWSGYTHTDPGDCMRTKKGKA